MGTSKIEWTESTWNPVIGCSAVSAGCQNCYAERMAKRLAAIADAARKRGDNPGRSGHYETVLDNYGHWNGCIYLDEDVLMEPLSWRSPRLVFVNSMSDLFHENVPLNFIQKLFDVVRRCRQHTFQVLTKRPERAFDFNKQLRWPPNLWIGASVENADTVHRIDSLRTLGATVRFLSCEPLLGSLKNMKLDGINWVIVGGESGPGARPMQEAWVQDILKVCKAASVPFFFKQWGGVNKKKAGRLLSGRVYDEMPFANCTREHHI